MMSQSVDAKRFSPAPSVGFDFLSKMEAPPPPLRGGCKNAHSLWHPHFPS